MAWGNGWPTSSFPFSIAWPDSDKSYRRQGCLGQAELNDKLAKILESRQLSTLPEPQDDEVTRRIMQVSQLVNHRTVSMEKYQRVEGNMYIPYITLRG